MGRIGSELSRRAIAFGMRVLAFDPYLSASRARSLQVELVEEIDELLAAADFISLAHAAYRKDLPYPECGTSRANKTWRAHHQLRAWRID